MRVERLAALVAAINTRATNLFLRKGRSMEVFESGREQRRNTDGCGEAQVSE